MLSDTYLTHILLPIRYLPMIIVQPSSVAHRMVSEIGTINGKLKYLGTTGMDKSFWGIWYIYVPHWFYIYNPYMIYNR